jgi:hypothetical protein
MAKERTPIVQVQITDEASAKWDHIRNQLRQRDESVRFPKTIASVKELEGTLEHLNKEIVAFVGLTGLGAFLGGGLVAGIAAATRAMAGFAQTSLNLSYTAKEIGLTVEQLHRLTDAGRVLGMSQSEAQGGVVRLTQALENLRTQGGKSAEFRRLAEGRGGKELANQLIAITRGPDGIYRAAEFLAQRTQRMDQRAQTSIKNIFGLPSVAWSEIFNLRGLHAVAEASTADMKDYMLQWVNLERTWYNTKVTLNQALMPALQSFLGATQKYLAGPGKELADQFAQWMRTLKPADIRNFVDSIGRGVTAFVNAIERLWPILKQIDKFVTENLGGWTTVLKGLASVAFITWLGSFASALGAIARLAPALALIGTIAALAPVAAQGAAGGGEDLGGGAIQLPEVAVTPQGAEDRADPRTRQPGAPTVPMPRPRPTERGEGDGDRLPVNARPTSGRVADLRQDREYLRDLQKIARKVTDQVGDLTDYLSGQGFTTSAAGAGGLAGVAGRLSQPMGALPGFPGGGGAPAAPGGGGAPAGGGGGGPRRRGGGGAPAAGGGGRRGGVPVGPGGDPNMPLPGGTGSSAIYQKLLTAYKNSGLVGTIPSDGARYGFKTGSAEEWARFGMIIAAAESDYRPQTAVSNRREQSFGIFQYNHPQVPGNNAFDVDASIRQFVTDSKKSMETHGGFTPGSVLNRRFSTIQSTPPPNRARQADAAIAAARQQPQPQQGAPPTVSPASQPPDKIAVPTTGGAWPAPVSGTTAGQVGDIRRPYPGSPGAHAHQGVDIPGKYGSPVIAQLSGTVERVYASGSAAGNTVVVRYANGYQVKFMHLAGFGKFRPGQTVAPGDVVGFLGGTGPGGREMYSKHLHYEVRDPQGRLVNPNTVLGIDPRHPRGVELTAGQKVGDTSTEPTKTTEVDPSIHKVLWTNMPDEKPAESFAARARRQRLERGVFTHKPEEADGGESFSLRARHRHGTNFALNIRIRGRPGVRVAHDSDGVLGGGATTVAREVVHNMEE